MKSTISFLLLCFLSSGRLYSFQASECANKVYLYIDQSATMLRAPTGGVDSPYTLALKALASIFGPFGEPLLNSRHTEVEVMLFGETLSSRVSGNTAFESSDQIANKLAEMIVKPPLRGDNFTDLTRVLNHIKSLVDQDVGNARKIFVIASDFAHDEPSKLHPKDVEEDVKKWQEFFTDDLELSLKTGLGDPYRNILLLFTVEPESGDDKMRRLQVLSDLVHLDERQRELALPLTGPYTTSLRQSLLHVLSPVSPIIVDKADHHRIELYNNSCHDIEVSNLSFRFPGQSPTNYALGGRRLSPGGLPSLIEIPRSFFTLPRISAPPRPRVLYIPSAALGIEGRVLDQQESRPEDAVRGAKRDFEQRKRAGLLWRISRTWER